MTDKIENISDQNNLSRESTKSSKSLNGTREPTQIWGGYNLKTLDDLMVNTALAMGYEMRDLRTYFYVYYAVRSLIAGLRGQSSDDYKRIVAQKVVDECNYITILDEEFYQDYFPVVNNLISFSGDLLFEHGQDIKAYHDYFQNRVYNNIDSIVQRIIKLENRVGANEESFYRDVNDIVQEWFDIWNAYWEYWIESAWKPLLNNLSEAEKELQLQIDRISSLEAKVEALEKDKIDYEERIAILEEKINNPFSSFLELKDEDEEKYNKEVRALQIMVVDFINLDYESILTTIKKNIKSYELEL